VRFDSGLGLIDGVQYAFCCYVDNDRYAVDYVSVPNERLIHLLIYADIRLHKFA